jgi:NADH-quinone oxidoreductase subunit A
MELPYVRYARAVKPVAPIIVEERPDVVASQAAACSYRNKDARRGDDRTDMDYGLETWFPIAVTLGLVGLIVGIMVTINRLIGAKSVHTTVKGEPFECGNPPSGTAWGRFSVRFYLTALLFLVFDVEVVFLYPWAVQLRTLGMFGFVEALVYIGILVVGLIYAWQRGALDWD